MRRYQLLASAIVLVRILHTSAAGQEVGARSPKLQSTGVKSTRVIFDQAETASLAGNELTQLLIKILDDKSAPDVDKSKAVEYLGRFRSVVAMRPLLDHLLLIDPAVTESGPLGPFPAARALRHFGRPLYSEIWGMAHRERSDEYLRVLAFVLHAMDGKDVAIIRLKECLADRQATELQIKNIKEVLGLLKELDFSHDAEWPRVKQ